MLQIEFNACYVIRVCIYSDISKLSFDFIFVNNEELCTMLIL